MVAQCIKLFEVANEACPFLPKTWVSVFLENCVCAFDDDGVVLQFPDQEKVALRRSAYSG